MSVPQRLISLYASLGIERAHIAVSREDDWRELVATHPEAVASLSLICPNGVSLDAIMHIACPTRILHGEHASGLDSLREITAHHARTSLDILAEYSGLLWSDIAADHPRELIRTVLAASASSRIPHAPSSLPKEGEIYGITYRTCGEGPPLLLFPLALAPSQWDPVLDALSAHFTVILLGGAELGMVAYLEARGKCIGYRETVLRVLERSHIDQACQILDIGCGTGVVTRLIAACCAKGAQITAVDVNTYFLSEARALATRDDLDHIVEFLPGNAEMLDFAHDNFDLSFSITVMEEVRAKAMLSEMVRVTRPNGRVAVVVRAVDVPRVVNAPLPEKLKFRVETAPEFTPRAAVAGCADVNLYRKFVDVGLEDVQIFPQLITYREPGRIDQMVRVIEANLSREDKKMWRQTVETARDDGTFFIATPMHCAIGKVPNAGLGSL